MSETTCTCTDSAPCAAHLAAAAAGGRDWAATRDERVRDRAWSEVADICRDAAISFCGAGGVHDDALQRAYEEAARAAW